jgi:hypothetical protein
MTCGGRGGIGAEPVRELLAGREVTIGEHRGPPPAAEPAAADGGRVVLHHYGPDNIAAGPGMQAPPHPHRAADGQLAPGR